MESEELKSNEGESHSTQNKNEVPTEKSSQDEISHKDEGDTRLPQEDSAAKEGTPPSISKAKVSFIQQRPTDYNRPKTKVV